MARLAMVTSTASPISKTPDFTPAADQHTAVGAVDGHRLVHLQGGSQGDRPGVGEDDDVPPVTRRQWPDAGNRLRCHFRWSRLKVAAWNRVRPKKNAHGQNNGAPKPLQLDFLPSFGMTCLLSGSFCSKVKKSPARSPSPRKRSARFSRAGKNRFMV